MKRNETKQNMIVRGLLAALLAGVMVAGLYFFGWHILRGIGAVLVVGMWVYQLAVAVVIGGGAIYYAGKGLWNAAGFVMNRLPEVELPQMQRRVSLPQARVVQD